MSSSPILKSKLIIPEMSRSILLTDRIRKLHEKMDCCRAVTVSAPAGYGKTTLVVSYFDKIALSSRICWYRMDPEDKNLSVFIAHLKETLFPSEEIDLAESRKALEINAEGNSQPTTFIKSLCREMWACCHKNIHPRTIIVLDDFQNVAQVQEINDMVGYMLDHLPPSCAIFILTRANVNVFSEKQKLEKKVLEINADDLAFSNSEIEELLFSMGQPAADQELTRFIGKYTEGWIAGIIILYQAVKSRFSDNVSINTEQLEHVDALFRYMSREVLHSVEDTTQNDLARLALLNDFSETEASQILGIHNIKQLIEKCMGFGMFIQRIPGDPVVYRFHSLFREFMSLVLNERYTEDQITELHLKAAEYYMSHETYGRAAEHLAKCGDSAMAMELVTKEGFNKFKIGETGQLKMWLDLLPDNMIRNNPVLLLFKAQLMPNHKQPEMIDTLMEVMRLSLQKNNLVIYYDAASVLIYIFMCGNNMKGLLSMTENNPGQLPGISPGLKNTLAILDMVRFIGEERFEAAEAVSESIHYDLLPDDSKWLYLVLSCIVYYCLGKLDNGERCMKTALLLNSFKKIEPSRGFILLFLSIILAFKNQRECLESYITEIIAIGEKYDYDYLCAQGKRLSAFERYLSHDAEASCEILNDAGFLYKRILNRAMAASCKLLQCLWGIRPGSAPPNVSEARKDLITIRRSYPGMMVYESSLSILGAIAREAGDYTLAERYLLTAVKKAKEKGGTQVVCGALFHISRLYYAMGDMEQGLCYLKKAMELGARNRYFMFWDIHIPTVVDIALRSIYHGFYTDYAEELLIKFYDTSTVQYLTSKIKYMNENKINAFVDGFVSSYKNDGSDRPYFIKASLLGKTEISVNGEKISDTEWKTKKVKGLLEYLLLCCGKTQSKEMLAEIFWPGSDSKSALASQRTALHYLRKVLTRYGAETEGGNAFIYETPEGLRIRQNDDLELDIHEFLNLESKLSKVSGSDSEMEKEIFEKMIALYKGDLLEGCDYGNHIFHEQERLRMIFVEACHRLGSICIKQGDLRHAEEVLKRALAADPLNENICLELIKLYTSEGQRSKAIKLYYKFKKSLEEELGIQVDKRLTEAIRG